MKRFYDTKSRSETLVESGTTIIETDDRVKGFFKPLEKGYRLEFTEDNLPLIVKIPDLTEEEQKAADAKKAEEDAKTNGEPYNGSDPVSFTSDDALGMLQVKTAFELGVLETNIKFSNGTTLNMKVDNFAAFATWFVTKRNSFFI